MPDEPEAMSVRVFPISAPKQHLVRWEQLEAWLDFEVDHLHAAYFDERESDEPEYWRQLYASLVFVLEDSSLLLARVTDRYLLRLDFIDLSSGLSVEHIPYASLMALPDEGDPIRPGQEDRGNAASGLVEGKLCFPGERVPSMQVYFHQQNTERLFSLEVGSNQVYNGLRLPPGTYQAYAYASNYGAPYCEYVLCEHAAHSCDSHAPVSFEVMPGETTYGIDICDWYAPQELIPLQPML